MIKKDIFPASVIVAILALLGLFFPGYLWGISWYTFLGPCELFSALVVAGLLVVLTLRLKDRNVSVSNKTIFVATALFGCLFYLLRLSVDFYGDAPTYLEVMGKSEPESYGVLLSRVLDPNIFHPGSDKITVLNAIQLMRRMLGMSPENAFLILDILSGMGFIMIWGTLVRNYSHPKNSAVLLVIGWLAPFTFQFYGHRELYAPLLPTLLAFFYVFLKYLETRQTKHLFWLVVTLVLALKLHITSILLLPAFLLGILYVEKRAWQKKFTPKNFRIALLPVLFSGLVVYFFIFKDHMDPRYLNESVSTTERLFLPLIPPDAPYDRYHLFSPYHLLDYFNILLLLSIPALILIFWSRKNSSTAPAMLAGYTVVLYLLFFFALNPLLGMPVDMDLFLIPGPVILILCLLRSSDAVLSPNGRAVLVATAAFGVFPILVNNNSRATGSRLQEIGEYSFKSYWIRSSQTIWDGSVAKKMSDADFESYYTKLINRLEPFANKPDDPEYADIVWRLARYFRKSKGSYQQALHYHKLSETYHHNYLPNVLGLMETYYLTNNYDSALFYAEKLAEAGYPEPANAFKTAGVCALKAGDKNKAVYWLESYQKMVPEDQTVNNVLTDVNNGLSINSVSSVFK